MAAVPADPKIGIVVLNWNGWRDTIQCLASLAELNNGNHAIYVVDNASTDGSESQLRAWRPGLRILQAGANLGWSGGNNVGIRTALAEGCEHVYLLNNDATVRPDTLRRLVEATGLPNAGALGSLILSADDPSEAEFTGTVVDPASHFPHQVYGPASEVDPSAVAMLAVKGCSMLLTGVALRRVGPLAEEYFVNYDETDWCYRAVAAGFVNYFVPASAVLHQGAVAFRGTTSPLYRFFTTRNRLLFARRHLDRVGRRFARRTALWEIKQAMLLAQPPGRGSPRHRALLLVAVVLGLACYYLGRLGDCPAVVRWVQRRYVASGTPISR
jgi:GT2 family glycosyltransferase